MKNSIKRVSSIQPLRKSRPEELTAQQTQTIFRTVYRITKNREDAEDAMQNAFMLALKHFGDFEGRAAFSTWLTRIAINSALMILRKRKNTRTISLGGPSDSEESKALLETRDPTPDAQQRYLQKERETALRDAIKELRPSFRSVVELAYLGERPLREVAEMISVSVAATKARLFHAREALRNSAKLHRLRSGEPARDKSSVLAFRPKLQKSLDKTGDTRKRHKTPSNIQKCRSSISSERPTPILRRNKCYSYVRSIRSARRTSDRFDHARERGYAKEKTIQRFLAAGYKKEQVMELLLGVALKTISNYLDHIFADSR